MPVPDSETNDTSDVIEAVEENTGAFSVRSFCRVETPGIRIRRRVPRGYSTSGIREEAPVLISDRDLVVWRAIVPDERLIAF